MPSGAGSAADYRSMLPEFMGRASRFRGRGEPVCAALRQCL